MKEIFNSGILRQKKTRKDIERLQECSRCDIRLSQCTHVSEYILNGTGCPYLKVKRSEYEKECSSRLEKCLNCKFKCKYCADFIFGSSECPISYHP